MKQEGSILDKPTSKYNESVELTPEDKEARVKILCKEPYAQEVYDKLVAHSPINGIWAPCKDLEVGRVYRVRAKQIDPNEKMILTEEVGSNTPVYVAFRDFSRDYQELIDGINVEFYVIITRDNKGEYAGSEKKALAITYKHELIEARQNKKYFDVKVERLIRGGFVATYRDTVKCFIPGSHAAANVIHDFDSYIGREIPVMIDNYDKANDLFIVSYKKYINHTMPKKVTELSFGKEYVGKLTDRPKAFGVFVEIDEYFTGLIHKTEFEDYETVKREWQAGDEVSVYIKDVSFKKGKYRIFLTLNQDEINDEKKHWSDIRDKAENKVFDYEADLKAGTININLDGEDLEIGVKPKELKKNVDKFPFVKVFKVDPINKRLKLDFVEER